jgi:hypothetical protein
MLKTTMQKEKGMLKTTREAPTTMQTRQVQCFHKEVATKEAAMLARKKARKVVWTASVSWRFCLV